MKRKVLSRFLWIFPGVCTALFLKAETDFFMILSTGLFLSSLLVFGSRNLRGQIGHFLLLITVFAVCFIIDMDPLRSEGTASRALLLSGSMSLLWIPALNVLNDETPGRSLMRSALLLIWILVCMSRPKAAASACLLLSFSSVFLLQMKTAGIHPADPAFWKVRQQKRLLSQRLEARDRLTEALMLDNMEQLPTAQAKGTLRL